MISEQMVFGQRTRREKSPSHYQMGRISVRLLSFITFSLDSSCKKVALRADPIDNFIGPTRAVGTCTIKLFTVVINSVP
jgi:hypothetical protein